MLAKVGFHGMGRGPSSKQAGKQQRDRKTMDDPMDAMEEERKKKEELELNELRDTIFLNERTFFSSRDFSGKGDCFTRFHTLPR